MIKADLAYRHFIHLDVGGVERPGIDLNQYNNIHGPAIARCSGPQRNDAHAICSLGPINVHVTPARATYRGLLLRAEKRLSKGFQILGSYAYPTTAGTNGGNGFNLDNWLQNTGPLATDITWEFRSPSPRPFPKSATHCALRVRSTHPCRCRTLWASFTKNLGSTR